MIILDWPWRRSPICGFSHEINRPVSGALSHHQYLIYIYKDVTITCSYIIAFAITIASYCNWLFPECLKHLTTRMFSPVTSIATSCHSQICRTTTAPANWNDLFGVIFNPKSLEVFRSRLKNVSKKNWVMLLTCRAHSIGKSY